MGDLFVIMRRRRIAVKTDMLATLIYIPIYCDLSNQI